LTRQTEESRKTGPEVADRVRRAAERWRRTAPEGYDREAFAELKEALDRDRPSYRKLFPKENREQEN
jgi:hypothetical protein